VEYKKLYLYPEELDLWENLVRVHLVLKRIKLSEQAIKVFIYFCAYGVSKDTLEKLIADKVVNDKQVYYNCRTFLKDAALIYMKKQAHWYINEPFASYTITETLDLSVRCKIKQ
jgi:hypothetical protein